MIMTIIMIVIILMMIMMMIMMMLTMMMIKSRSCALARAPASWIRRTRSPSAAATSTRLRYYTILYCNSI